MANLYESMGPGRDRTRDPWICSQTRICNQTRYQMRNVARYMYCSFKNVVTKNYARILLSPIALKENLRR